MKNLKEYIIEGAWGYEPDQNDGTLDLRGDIFFSICELIYDKCSKNPYGNKFQTDHAWESLGAIEYFFEELSNIEDFQCGDKNDFDKYYYWFRLIDKKKTKNIIELYEKLLNKCIKDEDWINNWREPEKMKESLEKRKQNLERYKKLLDDRTKYEQELELKRNQCKQSEVNFKQSEEQIEISSM